MIPDHNPLGWLILGFSGQACFSCRFLIQWISSERRRACVVPSLFWWFSVAGGCCLLIYAFLRKDIVIIVGQAGGLVVYIRNLILLQRQKASGLKRA
jgi:lipid-A-disaccharide synthase-like uncharacterized protein